MFNCDKYIRTSRTNGYSDKQSQNKPNLSQNKPNSNPIPERVKIDASCLFTNDYEEKRGYGPQKNKAKTNPILHPKGDRTEVRCQMSEITCFMAVAIKNRFLYHNCTMDNKLLKS
jgi:hypothetical protein